MLVIYKTKFRNGIANLRVRRGNVILFSTAVTWDTTVDLDPAIRAAVEPGEKVIYRGAWREKDSLFTIERTDQFKIDRPLLRFTKFKECEVGE